MYTPPQWRIAFPITLVVLLTLTGALVWGLQHAVASASVLCAGVIAGVLLAIAWTLRHFSPLLAAVAALIAILPIAPLGRLGAAEAAGAVVIAIGVAAVWFAIYDLGVTRKANAEVVSEVIHLETTGERRALIVYHSTHGGFQPTILRAFAAGLQSRGWRIDMTTASREAPINVNDYDLLVLGAPSYNWQPARPVIAYLQRLGDLNGLAVALVVSGGGLTRRALTALSGRVTRAHGRIVDAIEIWTTRSNMEQHEPGEPPEILRRAGERLGVMELRAPGGPRETTDG